MRKLLSVLAVVFVSPVFAGLVINAAEFGIGKFHRYDNKVHPYGANNAWNVYVLPDGAPTTKPLVIENENKSFTIFFATLEELLTEMKKISDARGEKVTVLNLNGHGLPGGMWFPVNEKTKKSFECYSWVEAAEGQDKANYDQYYTPIDKADIMSMRKYSQTGGFVSCVTDLTDWKNQIAKMDGITSVFADNLKLNFLSCIVGLGPVGEKFTNGLGAILSKSPDVQIVSTLYFGLGDWSMADGMGFWDYQNDEQLKKDNAIYPVTKKDSDIMQKGDVRVSSLMNGTWGSKVLKGLEYMSLTEEHLDLSDAVTVKEPALSRSERPQFVRIPGTTVYAPVH